MAITRIANFFKEYYISPGFYKRDYIKPTHVNFPITDNCNSKCRMCNVWKDKSENELLPSQIKQIFSDDLFSNTKHLGISGGEPTLRSDLLECIKSILDALPHLKTLSITSHGFHPTKWEKILGEIKSLCNSKNTKFSMNISVDGIGELHEHVRRVNNGWEKVLKTIKLINSNSIPLQIQSTISNQNIFGVNEIVHFAKQNKLDIVFRKATSIERLYNNEIISEFFTNNHENSFFSDFISSSEVNSITKNPNRRLFYKDLSSRLIKKGDRKAPCHFQNNGVLISAHGDMYHCSIDTKKLGNCLEKSPLEIYFSKKSKDALKILLENKCNACLHDQSGTWKPIQLIKEEFLFRFQKLNKILKLVDFAKLNLKYFSGSWKSSIDIIKSDSKKTIHIIGAYGGEHVGDSAILGGVITRLDQRYGSDTPYNIYSKRKDRTSFWVKGLNKDILKRCNVKEYKSLQSIQANKSDVLVWAGGPIMEMPLDLLSHLITIKAFLSKGLRFEIIGCGLGPFKTKFSKRLASKIIASAKYIEMRDKYPINIEHKVKKDPAFDYLFNNQEPEKFYSKNLSKSIEFVDKIKSQGYKKIVLLNLRPIWSKYNKSRISDEQLDSRVVDTFFNIIKGLPKDTAVVSVPFNTDHYGFSDMIPALRLKDLTERENLQNYFIFNRELNAREMISFLKNFDSGICMRFHACIFMKGLNIPVYGIDYTAGEKGKVGGLFSSFQDTNISNILDIDHKKILDFLNN